MRKSLRRHASALFDVLALLIMLLAGHAAWAVTLQYDSLNRLIKATYQNGTVVEYAYDATGNRLQKKIRSTLPPEVVINTPEGPFGPYTWDKEHTISGTATDRSGTNLVSVEVSVSQLVNGVSGYWNGTGWGSPVEIWNPVPNAIENWRYPLDKGFLQGGGWYTLRSRTRDGEGRYGYSETRSFTYDNTMPGTAGHVRLLDASSILVSFTKVVSGAENAVNYGISGGVSVFKVDKVDGKTYVLRLSQPLTAGLGYEFVLSNITDLAGNPLDGGSSRTTLQNHSPVAPGTNSPSNNGEVQSLHPTLSVSNASDQDGDSLSYAFEVFTDSGFTQLVAFKTGVAEGNQSTEWEIDTPLQENTRYWWRSRAHDGVFHSLWCSSTFLVNLVNDPPGKPTLRSPAPGAHVPTRTPLLEVVKAADPDSLYLVYDFQIYADEAGAMRICEASGLLEGAEGIVSCPVGMDLSDITLYYWRARARDDKGAAGPWTELSPFRINTANDSPSAPSILYPAQGQEITDFSLTLEIGNAHDADMDPLMYAFELDRDSTFTGPDTWRSSLVLEGIGTRTACALPMSLSDNTLYFWRARAYDAKAYGQWSQASFFTNKANDRPETPRLREPCSIEVHSHAPALRVYPAKDQDLDAITYKFEVFGDAALDEQVDAGETQKETWELSRSLNPGATYYWRVCSVDEHGLASEWSAPSWFRVSSAGSVPGIPTVNSPAQGGMVVGHQPALSVVNASDSQGYHFELYGDPQLRHLLESAVVIQGESITAWLPQTTFKDGGSYFWRCRALNGVIPGPWMPTARFEVNMTGASPEVLLEAKENVLPSGRGVTHIQVVKTGSPLLGMRLEIPDGALSRVCEISIGVVRNPPALPLNTRYAGRVVDLGPDGTVFSKPVTVVIQLQREELDGMGVKDLRELKVFTFVPGKMGWEEVPVDYVDNENFLISFKVRHFSMYVAVKETAGAESSAADGEASGGSGCFISSLGCGGSTSNDQTIGVLDFWLSLFAMLLTCRRRTSSSSPHPVLIFAALLAGLLLFPGLSLATTASISVSGSEGHISVSASASFSAYEDNDSGTLDVYHNSSRIARVPGSGSASWTTTMDGGLLPQGENIFSATAVDSRGISHVASTSIFIDNTPKVTVQSPGQPEGYFDITGTVQFKPCATGKEGVVEIYIDTTSWRYKQFKWFEGTGITWTYSDIAGAMLDAGAFANGEHKVYVKAMAANGTWSEWGEASFFVENTPKVTIQSPGNVEGLFDITGTIQFKDYPGGMEGQVELDIDTTSWRYKKNKWYEGTGITWIYSDVAGDMLDAGAFSNGEHKIYARGQAANGAWSEWTEASFFVDNTPTVSVQNQGMRQGFADIVGTANFKEYHGGKEGTVILNADSTGWRYELCRKAYEGRSITWSYSDMTGKKLDLSTWAPGVHKIYVMAVAANGVATPWAQAELEVIAPDGLARPYNLGAGAGPCECRPYSDNPINFATGNKYHKETDVIHRGPGILMAFRRHYNSQAQSDGPIGRGWSTTFSDRVTEQGGALLLTQADGRQVLFEEVGAGVFHSVTDELRVIEKVPDGYRLKEPEGTHYSFDSQGRPAMITDRNGNTQILTYQDTLLQSVEDNFGRRLDFTYNQDGRLASVSGPAGKVDYVHDTQGNLVEITCLDGNKRRYLYEDSRYPQAMTGIIQENGLRYATYAYDSEGRAVLSKHAGDSRLVHVEYGPGLKRKLTDSLGRVRTFDLQVTQGIGRIKTSSGSGCGSCPGEGGSAHDLDERLRIETSTDASGAMTVLTHDNRGNVLTRTEAYGTPEQRTLSFSYHDKYSLPTSIKRQSLSGGEKESVVQSEYDERGNLLKRTETGFDGAASVTRSTTYSYDEHGSLRSVDGPREDVNDVATVEYYPNTPDQGFNRGMVRTVLNALGQETTFSQYNGLGSPGRIVNMNGTVTLLAYDLRWRLVSKTVNGLEIRYTYDPLGNLSALALPGGRTTSFTYNEMNLLEHVRDQEGNYLLHAYDTEGNRIKEEVHDKTGTLKRFLNAQYDDKNRLNKIIHPDGASETIAYDAVGSVLSRTDPNARQIQHGYDILRRLLTMTEPGDVITRFTYDSHDHLVSVTDARNNATTYAYDDLGRLVRTNSPDTNVTSYTYDASDNLISSTDGRGISTSYQYDTLNRLKRIEQPDSSEAISLNHDEGTGGKGRLTSMVDPAGRTEYTYDELGRLTTERRTMEGTAYTTQYAYDGNGSLVGMAYPSGLVVEYQRDGTGRISGVKVNGQTLTSGSAYLPFGPLSGRTLGSNLLNVARTHDQRYQLKAIQAGPLLDYQYTYDPAGNITAISGVTEPTPSGETRQYEYAANRLASITAKEQRQYTHDGAGNIIFDGVFNYTYNQSGRLVKVTKGGDLIAEYAYDGLARRVKKTVAGSTTLFHYDRQANLIAETTTDGTPLRDIIYMNGERIAMKLYGHQAGIYYFLNDHLGTAHMVIDAAGQIVWHAAYLPFGQAQILTEKIPNHFRFPGQYFDSETGLHYNYFRYYDPTTGRYLTPDPIGLTLGTNIYLYVNSNPLQWVDPHGLWKDRGHRRATVDPMLEEGFSAQDALWAADANVRVDMVHVFDDEYHGTPGVLQRTYELLNEQLEKAINYELEGKRQLAMEALGVGMHPLQDIPAHQHLGATSIEMWLHHAPLGSDPDDECKHPEKFDEAIDRTKWYLEKFLREVSKRRSLQ